MTTVQTDASELKVTGVLTGPPTINEKRTVLRFSIRKDAARTRRNPTYLNVKVFNDAVEAVEQTLSKATPWDTTIHVAGEFVEERFESNGQKRRAVYCYADTVSMQRQARKAAS